MQTAEMLGLEPFTSPFSDTLPDFDAEPAHETALTLRPYQLQEVEFLQTQLRAIITSEPGLGKTFVGTEAAKDSKTITISAPGYLTDQWFDFICEQYPGEPCVLASGTRAQRTKALRIPTKWRIINHEMMRSFDIPPTDTLIIDEMHHFRNRNTAQAKGMLNFAKTCRRVYGLTATPIVKDPDDMFMLLRIIDPATFTSYNDFVTEYCTFSNSMYGIQVTGIRSRSRWQTLMAPYVMGHTYEDVGMQLPTLIPNMKRIRLTNEHMTLYNDIKYNYMCELEDGEFLTFDNALTVLHALRAITSNAPEKRDYASSIATDLPNFVLFTWYKSAAHYLAEALDATLITGDLPIADRTALARSSSRIVATISSLKEGVDLSHVRNVVFFEEWYTYGVMHQVLSRVHRFRPDGSPEPVNAYYIHADKTIDQGIHQVSKNRRATANSVKDLIKKELAR